MKDFIFGTLATEELRQKFVRTHRAGVSHYQNRQPRDPLPGQAICLKLSVGPEYPSEHAWVYWTNDGTDPTGQLGKTSNGHVSQMEVAGVEWDTNLWGYIQHFKAEIPGQPAGSVLRYLLSAGNSHGQEVVADEGGIYACYIDDDPPPAWTQEAIVYQIFVDRFYPGKDKSWLSPQTPAGFYGGTLTGIVEKLDYLDELGVNVLWLTPIFPSPSHHAYNATDLFDIEPRLGTKAELGKLLEEAHQRGMRVLLDLVPNHVSNLHPTFQSAQTDRDSRYRSWYTFTHWPDKYRSFFDVPELPQLNLRDPSARQHMLEAAAFWLELGVDGYRVDYAIGPTPDFWADFRRVTREKRPDCWTFGEVVEPPDAQINFEGLLDGCLDFNLMEALRQAFAYDEWDADRLANFIGRHEAFFPEAFSRPSFLDNHDMNRILWAAGGDQRRLRLAAMCQFTLSGAPIIYYGTEIGLSQERDVRQDGLGLPEEARLPMIWGDEQDTNLLEYYRKLIHLRRELTGELRGKTKVIFADQGMISYTHGRDDKVLTILNLSQKESTYTLPDGRFRLILEATPDSIQLENLSVIEAPLGGAIFMKE